MTGLVSDERLATRVGQSLGALHPVFAAATVTPTALTVAVQGAAVDADFEIGSVSKGITGLLYRDALAREEIGPDTTLGSLLPLGEVPAAEVTLASITTHHSGLPGLPKAARPLRRTIALWRHGTNPYGETLEQLLAQARTVAVGSPRARYSNFGFELLGHALAAAAGETFADLVRKRVAGPLGLENCYVPATRGELRPGALVGRSVRGASREPWTGEGLGPAGGIRASVQDLARLAQGLLTGAAPGTTALDPVRPFGNGARIGAGWVTTEVDGRAITWQNGGTGGFRCWLGLDRDAGTGAAIVSATSASVDRHGFTLLADQSDHAAQHDHPDHNDQTAHPSRD